jgi:hypothetical protein
VTTRFRLPPTSRSELGASAGLGCQGCPLFEICGGTFEDFDCLAHCCNEKKTCTTGCPRSDNFAAVLQDAGGLTMKDSYDITQARDDLPAYIPLIHNGSSRSEPLDSPYVALTTFDVVSPRTSNLAPRPGDLRKRFGVSSDARILLVSIGKDNRLEGHWQYEGSRRFAEHIAKLGVSHVTAPNFSFPLDVPRTEHLVNRARSLKSAERLAAAGASVIVHLNAYNENDWDSWHAFLRNHPHIVLIAQEFQTGLASRSRASWHIWHMRDLEQSLGRGLHLIAVAGRRHLPLLAGLSRVTIVDSVPFMRACMRRRLDRAQGKWIISKTPIGQPIDNLLRENVNAYRAAVEEELAFWRRMGALSPERRPFLADSDTGLEHAATPGSDLQYEFWPTRTREAEIPTATR